MTDSPLIIKQPDNGGGYTLNRPMTRGEIMDLLHRCQDGDASCLYTLNVFEADHDLRNKLLLNALTLIRDGDKMDYRAWAKSVASAGLRGEMWLEDFSLDTKGQSK